MNARVRMIGLVLAAALLVGATGCEFSNSERRKTEAATTEDMSAFRAELGRLRQDVDALIKTMRRAGLTAEEAETYFSRTLHETPPPPRRSGSWPPNVSSPRSPSPRASWTSPAAPCATRARNGTSPSTSST